MTNDIPEPVRVWLVMLKAMHAISRFASSRIVKSGIGDSDFRVLEVLLHKGPLPVNTIGPKVNLTPGSISVAVDRLHSQGLVSRMEDSNDRRIRIVALTPKGRRLIVSMFRCHAATMTRIFSEIDPEELRTFEAVLKKIGRRAEGLERSGSKVD
jgi:MarR family 2-MHQ and catechol resistance regulon transcriptional repressor